MERLTKRILVPKEEREVVVFTQGEYNDTIPAEMTHDDIRKVLRKLAEYEGLEEQGLLLRLPCKVGDTVYTACAWGIESGVVGNIEFISDRIFVNNIHGEMIGEAHNIFLTREEAEQKLKEMESDRYDD